MPSSPRSAFAPIAALALLLLPALPAHARDPVDFSTDRSIRTGWIWIQASERMVTLRRRTLLEGRVLQDEQTTEGFRYECRVEVARVEDGRMTGAQLHFSQATFVNLEGEVDLGLSGHTVVAQGRPGARRFERADATPFTEIQLIFLQTEFAGSETGDDDPRASLLPRSPVATGQTWTPDLADVARAFGLEDESFEPAAGSGLCRLVELGEQFGLLFGRVEFRVQLPPRPQTNPAPPPSPALLEGAFDAVVDGSRPYGAARLRLSYATLSPVEEQGRTYQVESAVKIEVAVDDRPADPGGPGPSITGEQIPDTPAGPEPGGSPAGAGDADLFAVRGNGLAGLYVATEGKNRFNASGRLSYRVRTYHALFLPDGRLCLHLPAGGLAGLTFEQIEAEQPETCGRYALDGPNLVVDLPGEDRDAVEPIQASDGGAVLRIGARTYVRVDLARGGRAFSGTYRHSGFTDTSSGDDSTSGGVAGEHTLVFTRDGRFQGQDFIGNSGRVDAPSGDGSGLAHSESGLESGAGRYWVGDGSLLLEYADGRRVRHAFYLYPDAAAEPEPGVLVIDGITFERVR